MAISKVMHDALFKIARANPGVVLDKAHSSTHDLIVVDPKKNRTWHIDNRGRIRRLVRTG